MTVATCGEKYSFEFSAAFEINYLDVLGLNREIIDEAELDAFEQMSYADIDDTETIDWDYICSVVDSATLEESFWEAMNDNPEREIISLMKKDSRYSDIESLPSAELEEMIYCFVKDTLVTATYTYELDGRDITSKIDSEKGEWDDLIFTQITNSIISSLHT